MSIAVKVEFDMPIVGVKNFDTDNENEALEAARAEFDGRKNLVVSIMEEATTEDMARSGDVRLAERSDDPFGRSNEARGNEFGEEGSVETT